MCTGMIGWPKCCHAGTGLNLVNPHMAKCLSIVSSLKVPAVTGPLYLRYYRKVVTIV